jgi:hypothetical protein
LSPFKVSFRVSARDSSFKLPLPSLRSGEQTGAPPPYPGRTQARNSLRSSTLPPCSTPKGVCARQIPLEKEEDRGQWEPSGGARPARRYRGLRSRPYPRAPPSGPLRRPRWPSSGHTTASAKCGRVPTSAKGPGAQRANGCDDRSGRAARSCPLSKAREVGCSYRTWSASCWRSGWGPGVPAQGRTAAPPGRGPLGRHPRFASKRGR